LQGLLSSHLVLALLQAPQAAATRLPEAIRCALRIALLKDLLLLSASMGMLAIFFLPTFCFEELCVFSEKMVLVFSIAEVISRCDVQGPKYICARLAKSA
jgi:hypothetical protein